MLRAWFRPLSVLLRSAGAVYATAPRGQAAGAAVMPQININVYGAEGQDENALAEIIMRKIQAATARKEDLWR